MENREFETEKKLHKQQKSNPEEERGGSASPPKNWKRRNRRRRKNRGQNPNNPNMPTVGGGGNQGQIIGGGVPQGSGGSGDRSSGGKRQRNYRRPKKDKMKMKFYDLKNYRNRQNNQTTPPNSGVVEISANEKESIGFINKGGEGIKNPRTRKPKNERLYQKKQSGKKSKKKPISFDKFDQMFDRKSVNKPVKNPPPRILTTLLQTRQNEPQNIPSPYENISTVQNLRECLEETAQKELTTMNRGTIFGEWITMLKVNERKKFFDGNFSQGMSFKDVFLQTSCLQCIIRSVLEQPELDKCHEQLWELLSILFNSTGENDDNFETFYMIEKVQEIGRNLRGRGPEVVEIMNVHLMSIVSLLVTKDEFLRGNLVWLEKQILETQKKLRTLGKEGLNHQSLSIQAKHSATLVDLCQRKKKMLQSLSKRSSTTGKELKESFSRQKRVFEQAIKKDEDEKGNAKLKVIKEKFSELITREDVIIQKCQENTDKMLEKEDLLVKKKNELEEKLRAVEMELSQLENEKEREILKSEECTRKILDLNKLEEKEISKVQENSQIPLQAKHHYHDFAKRCKKIMENSYSRRNKFYQIELSSCEFMYLGYIKRYLNFQKNKILNYLEKRLSIFFTRIWNLREEVESLENGQKKARRLTRIKKYFRKYLKSKSTMMSIYETSRCAMEYVSKYTAKNKNERELIAHIKEISDPMAEIMRLVNEEYFLNGDEWEDYFNDKEKELSEYLKSPESEMSRSPSIDSIGSFMSDSDISEAQLEF